MEADSEMRGSEVHAVFSGRGLAAALHKMTLASSIASSQVWLHRQRHVPSVFSLCFSTRACEVRSAEPGAGSPGAGCPDNGSTCAAKEPGSAEPGAPQALDQRQSRAGSRVCVVPRTTK